MSLHRACCCQTPADLWEIEPENAVQWGEATAAPESRTIAYASISGQTLLTIHSTSSMYAWTAGDVFNQTPVFGAGAEMDAMLWQSGPRVGTYRVDLYGIRYDGSLGVSGGDLRMGVAGFALASRMYAVYRFEGTNQGGPADQNTVRVAYKILSPPTYPIGASVVTPCKLPPVASTSLPFPGRMRPFLEVDGFPTRVVYGGYRDAGAPSLVAVNFASTHVLWFADTGAHVWDVSPAANRIAVAQTHTNGASVLVYDYDGNFVESYDTGGNIRGVSVGPGGEVYAAGTRTGGVSVWRFQPGDTEPDWTYDTGANTTACLVHNGLLYVSGTRSSTWRYPAP